MPLELKEQLFIFFISIVVTASLFVSYCGGNFLLCFTLVTILSLLVSLTFFTGLSLEQYIPTQLFHLLQHSDSITKLDTNSTMFRSYNAVDPRKRLLKSNNPRPDQGSNVTDASAGNRPAIYENTHAFSLPRVRQMHPT